MSLQKRPSIEIKLPQQQPKPKRPSLPITLPPPKKSSIKPQRNGRWLRHHSPVYLDKLDNPFK